VIIAILIYAAVWLLSPHPDATLHPTAGGADDSAIEELTANVGDPDISTLRHFEARHPVRYRALLSEIGPWTGQLATYR
jgi:hypothetical protein